MSTLKVDGIRSNSATSDAISLADNGTCTASITNNLSNRNKVINGAMLISQRGITFSPDNTEQPYTLDRFQHVATSGADGDCTITHQTDVPTGFRYSYKITPDATNTPTGGGNVTIRHRIEGQDLQDLEYGTSSAKKMVVSFYAKTASANSGDQYTICLFYSRSDGTQKTINASFTPTSTWQRFTFSFVGDTDSSYGIRNDINSGLTLTWVLAAGPDDVKAAMTTWTVDGGYFRGVTGQDNFMDNTNNEFYLTGVQLEVDHTGSGIATDFEHRSYSDELFRCQRYFYMHVYGTNVNNLPADSSPLSTATRYTNTGWFGIVQFPVQMRTTPSHYKALGTDALRLYNPDGSQDFNDIATQDQGINACIINYYDSLNSGQPAGWVQLNGNSFYFGFNAEM